MIHEWKIGLAVAIGALSGCGDGARDEIGAGSQDQEIGADAARARTFDLFMNSCRDVGRQLVCSPARMTVSTGSRPRTTTQKLPEVRHSVSRHSNLIGSTADVQRRRVFWHADCDTGYHVTDVDTGRTRTFALDADALGLVGNGNGFCLGEWVFDEKRGTAIALVGSMTQPLGKSTVDYVLAIDGEGGARVLFDLRGKLDPRWLFLHQFQTIAELDPATDEVITPLVMAGADEDRLVLNVVTGDVRLIGPGGGRQHAFFDKTSRRPTFFQCTIPGWTSDATGPVGAPRIPIDTDALGSVGIDEICKHGFIGGGYDPLGRRAYLLLRRRDISDPNDVFLLASADLAANRFLGFIETDARYGDFRAEERPIVEADTFFWSTEILPRK
jgi:hypothetical protein